VAEHPFAPFVRILGKGKKGTRSLDRQEAREAMGLILDDKVSPEQLGAFLMLLRVKEESPEELAGFVDAVRERAQVPTGLQVDLDWSSYAGKRRQLPWFFLSAMVLAKQGYKLFMHGAKGHTEGRIYTESLLELFGLAKCHDWQQVEQSLEQHNFAFMAIDQLQPRLASIIELRSLFGLRSPVHTLCRMLNPLLAKHTVDGVFHLAYAPMHQQTSALLGVEQGLTIRGDGGEAELRPDSLCEVRWIRHGELIDSKWPRYFDRREVKDPDLRPQRLLDTWRGTDSHRYGEGAVIATLAATLVLLGRESEPEAAHALAEQLWQARDKHCFG